MEGEACMLDIFLRVQDYCPGKRLNTAHFHPKMGHRMAPRRNGLAIEHPFAIM